MLNETQALELAKDPNKIISAEDCNTVIAFLNGFIVDLALTEFEGQIAADNELAKLLHTEGKTNAVATVEWRLSDTYRQWRLLKLELAKLRAYRKVLQKKEEMLTFTSRRTRDNYDRVI